MLESLLRLTDAEREFVDELQRGDIKSKLLYPGNEEAAEQVKRHPALRWKVQNAEGL